MTIKEIEDVFRRGDVTEDFLNTCKCDARKTVQAILRRYERTQQERARLYAMYAYERCAAERGHCIVAGVDEAGRGPLAGPVAVAAVILPQEYLLLRLNDSKKLSEKVRKELYERIVSDAVSYHVELIDAETIDRMNILEATRKGMYDAVAALLPTPQEVLIDAVALPHLRMASQSIVKGDAKSA